MWIFGNINLFFWNSLFCFIYLFILWITVFNFYCFECLFNLDVNGLVDEHLATIIPLPGRQASTLVGIFCSFVIWKVFNLMLFLTYRSHGLKAASYAHSCLRFFSYVYSSTFSIWNPVQLFLFCSVYFLCDLQTKPFLLLNLWIFPLLLSSVLELTGLGCLGSFVSNYFYFLWFLFNLIFLCCRFNFTC